jgi:hypothetical protein
VPLLMSIGIFWFIVRPTITEDAFTYTHYPIRMNRKNRTVYAFRRDGTVLKAGWDEMVWTIYNTRLGMGDVCVMGHVMQDGGKLIKESVALGMVDAGEPGRRNLLQYFEFFRRYMEEGPEPVLKALRPTPLIMLPGIDHSKESWAFGWERITLVFNGWAALQVLFQVVFFPISLFRWFVMRTSKIPQWPQWVLDECVIEPGDAWERDGRHRA